MTISGLNARGGQQTYEGYSREYIAANATTLVKTGGGLLKRIIIGSPVAAATVILYDALTATGTPVASLVCDAAVLSPVQLDFDYIFTVGLTVVTSGATKVTVIAR